MKVFGIIPEFRILRLTFKPQNAELGRLYSFPDIFSVYIKTIDHLNLKLLVFVGTLQVLRFEFLKFRIL